MANLSPLEAEGGSLDKANPGILTIGLDTGFGLGASGSGSGSLGLLTFSFNLKMVERPIKIL